VFRSTALNERCVLLSGTPLSAAAGGRYNSCLVQDMRPKSSPTPKPPLKPVHKYRFGYDRAYFREFSKLAAPIILQGLAAAALNMVGTIMVGQKGETAVAAVGLAGQMFFLLTLAVFGIASGSAIFTAQLWGKRDTHNIHRVLGLTLALALLAGIIFFLLAEIFPSQVMALYSNDPAVVKLGSDYLRIYGYSFLFFAVTVSYSTVLRSIGNVRLPMIVSSLALVLNTLLSYGLIFGKFGLPVMGVTGAAVAIVISRVLECAGIVAATYLSRSPVSAGLKEILDFDWSFVLRVLKPVLPVALNEVLWSLGITTYNAIYAHIGTESIAAVNMLSTIENLAWAFMNGISLSTAVMVGHRIGRGEEEQAHQTAGLSLWMAGSVGVLVGAVALLGGDSILALFNVSPVVIANAHRLLIIFGSILWVRAMNATIVLGILRAGGDTRFSLFLDGFIIWIVGVPLAALGVFVFHLPVHWVYLLAMSEEITKCCIGLIRFFSRKWIHNLTHTLKPAITTE
jgi:putative MATE family efflux protein